jgi:tryptophanyl-tRNA synthetase
MNKETILSGVQATGRMHIGNYLGALKQFVDIQNEGKLQCYFFVADLHALTVPRDPKQLRADTIEVVAEYIAAGLNPKQSVIFIQNHVLEHTELAWIFN